MTERRSRALADPEGADTFDCRVCHKRKLPEKVRVCYIGRERVFVEKWGKLMTLSIEEMILMGPDENVSEGVGTFQEPERAEGTDRRRAVCPMAAVIEDDSILEIVQLEAEWETYGSAPIDGSRSQWPQEAVEAFRVVRQAKARTQIARHREQRGKRNA